MTDYRHTTALTSWGRVLRPDHEVAQPRFADELRGLVAARDNVLPVGLGRSYGDSGLNPGGAVIAMRGLDRIHAFDAATGLLRADGGISLDAIIRFAAPRGWFPPVVPGSRFVTLGGAIANDVHGKNHHRAGTFGRHVRRIGLLRSDGVTHELSPQDDSGLFAATIGGLGLTGVIAWAEVQLARAGAWYEAEDVPFREVDGYFDLMDASVPGHEQNVAWIDCTAGGASLGRGIFSRANPAAGADRAVHREPRLSLPVDLPAFALNPVTLKAFNTAYYAWKAARRGRRRAHYDGFFFPLDTIGDWNRLYGPRGFYQYQCVVPTGVQRDAVRELLLQIARSGQGSFLAVLKSFGSLSSPGLLSFPMAGATLALDFQNRGDVTLRLLERLDAVVFEAGGRLYPAKDGRISATMFRAGYPNLDVFSRHVDPRMSSAFWRRVAG